MTAEHLLASWRDTATRRAIVEFVRRVSDDGPEQVPVEDRVATFDNDGTLWSEKPMPVELGFILERLAGMAAVDRSLRERQPWQAAYTRDLAWLAGAVERHYEGDDADIRLLLGGVLAAQAGLGVEEYAAAAADFVRKSINPGNGRAYVDCGYAPMIELVRYLEANGFTVYIASGGDRDFMRPFASEIYGLAPERVIGSSSALRYDADTDRLLYADTLEVFDDGPVKPVRIWSRTGRRPLVAAGNSDGDIPMLRFAGGPRPALRLLVDHDDPDREFGYARGAEQALSRAASDGWVVVSMRSDWKVVYHDVE